MIEDSQVLLSDFLFKEKYQLLQNALRNMAWTRHWRPDSRCVDLPKQSSEELPEPVRAVLRLLASDAMMVVLTDMTGLSLHPAARRIEDEEDEEDEGDEKKEEEEAGPSRKKPRTEGINEDCSSWRTGEWHIDRCQAFFD